MAPILLIHFIVVIIPSLQAFYYSMTDWSGIGAAEWVGFQNFQQMIFDDSSYRSALFNNVKWLLVFLTVPFAMALVAAQLLAPVKKGAMWFRTLLFIPYVLPSVINANIWRNLMSPRQGLGAQVAQWGENTLGTDQLAVFGTAFLGKTETALMSIAFVDNWHFWGFLMVLFLTAMQGISQDLYDAAKIDGANRLNEFIHVTIPGILPTLAFMMLLVAIWSFLVFDYVWILTQGGPASSSEVLGSYLYKQVFNRFEAGYASAIGLSMSLFAGVIIGIFALLRRRGWEI
ncbi:MAG: sugar ABC transporter permease [Caldilineaceae bacterium]|nr:sugar ABC transporter permease [Caldilineaceae bacterium]